MFAAAMPLQASAHVKWFSSSVGVSRPPAPLAEVITDLRRLLLPFRGHHLRRVLGRWLDRFHMADYVSTRSPVSSAKVEP